MAQARVSELSHLLLIPAHRGHFLARPPLFVAVGVYSRVLFPLVFGDGWARRLAGLAAALNSGGRFRCAGPDDRGPCRAGIGDSRSLCLPGKIEPRT